MSGPKSGRYRVVSEEELRRRRLAAAKDRYARLAGAFGALTTEISAAVAAYGAIAVAMPDPVGPPLGDNVGSWEDAIAQFEAVLQTSRASTARALTEARVEHFAASAASITGSSALSAVATSRPERSVPSKRDEELERVLGRIPADASADVVKRCVELASQARTATPAARQQIVSALRLVIQSEQDRHQLVASNSSRVEDLYQELDGLRGRAVEILRGLLRGLQLDQPLPDDLSQRVEATSTAVRAEQDREFVVAASAAAFRELGYEVGDAFDTAVPADGALLSLPHSTHHGVRIRERDHQLLVNVVRYDEDDELDPSADRAAEESFCADFALLRGQLEERGIDLAMLREDQPGATPMQVIPRNRRPSAPRQARRQAPRERRP